MNRFMAFGLLGAKVRDERTTASALTDDGCLIVAVLDSYARRCRLRRSNFEPSYALKLRLTEWVGDAHARAELETHLWQAHEHNALVRLVEVSIVESSPTATAVDGQRLADLSDRSAAVQHR